MNMNACANCNQPFTSPGVPKNGAWLHTASGLVAVCSQQCSTALAQKAGVTVATQNPGGVGTIATKPA